MNNYVDLYNEGTDLILNNELIKAEKIFLFLIKKKPEDFNSLINLGSIYLKKGLLVKSLKFYLAASKVKEDDIIFNSLATVYFYLKNFKESQNFYLKALKINPQNTQALLNIANFYFELKKFNLSKKYYLKYYFFDKKNIIFYRCISKVNHEIGLFSETSMLLKKAIRNDPGNLYLQFLYLNLFPKVHFNKETKNKLIKRYEMILDKLINDKDKFIFKSDEIIDILTTSSNFYLAYCKNVTKTIYEKYSLLINFFLKKIYTYSSKDFKNSRKKIVIISSFFYNHTVSRLFKNFFKKLNLKFDVTVFYLGSEIDSITLEVKKNSKEFIHNQNLNFCINFLKEKNFDIVYFPEVGMCPKTQLLSFLRFAKLQIVSWGHPITTGSSVIDYFISSDFMEIDNSREFYTEKLLKLPDIGIDLDPKIFTYNGKKKINNTRNNIINLQSLFKILPEDFYFYFKIVKKLPNIKFYFIKDSSENINNKFFLNFKMHFDIFFDQKIKFNNHFFFINRMKRKEFLKNLSIYDLGIDTFGWSGGNTTIEALLSDLPVVTLPSQEMRSRHSSAFLKQINLDYLIAKNENDLLSKIQELVTNDEIYSNVIAKIQENKEKLFSSNSFNNLQYFLESY